jgi:hypothetical protein
MPTRIGELTVREPGRLAGGRVVDARPGASSDTIAGKGTAILLVHGYNNSHDAARASFEQFVLDLEDAIGTSPFPWPVFGVQWPGDEENPVASAACYPAKVPVAEAAAEKIAAYLSQTFGSGGGPVTLHVVAHSLGCRLTLDLLALLERARPSVNVVIGKVTLMAAAVPVAHVQADGDLRAGLSRAGGVGVLHSTSDPVLHYAFPAGQTAAHDGFFPTAVGRYGDPLGAWVLSRAMSHDGKGYGHSDYWPGAESVRQVAAFLGFAVASETPVSSLGWRSLPQPNTIASRTLPT